MERTPEFQTKGQRLSLSLEARAALQAVAVRLVLKLACATPSSPALKSGGANVPPTTLLSSQAPHHIVVAGPFFVIVCLGR